MDDLRTNRQKELERLRNEQREDLGALRSAGVKAFLDRAPEGVVDPPLAELALRREAKSRRTGAVAQSIISVFSYLDALAAVDVVRRLHAGTPATRAIVSDLAQDLYEIEPPVLDAEVLGAYVVLVEAADLLAPDAAGPAITD